MESLRIELPEPLQEVATSVSRPALVCTHCGGWKFIKRRKSPKGHQTYLCKLCGRHFTHNPDRFVPVIDPAAEYEKDIWDCRNLGLAPRIGKFNYKLNFKRIQIPWLLQTAKLYIRYVLSTLSLASGIEKILSLSRFSEFLTKTYPAIEPLEIDRSVMVEFLGHLASQNLSATTKSHTISAIRNFFEVCVQNEWISFRRYLIRPGDFPKQPKYTPRFIPQEVLRQLNQHLPELPEPVMRMVIVLQECGMRISELLYLKFDCLLQDKSGDWFLRYYQFKMQKEITIPISRELVAAIQEQQRYIQSALNVEFEYLFCANEGGGRKGSFTASPKNMSTLAFSIYLNKLAKKHNICDVSNKLWHFQAHQFRHSVGTRMINNGVPQHIVQRYLGHESPNMTAVYCHIFDQTMKVEIAKYQGKVVNIAGQVVEPNAPEVETSDLSWFKRNIQAQALPNGSCALPTISQGCPHANACLSCSHFRTTPEFLDEHTQQLEQTEKIIDKAKANGWQRQVEMNDKVAANLRNIIRTLEAKTMTEVGGSYLGWERNTEGIKAAAQKKRQEAFARTEEAIKKLLREKQSINFETVCETANVTRAWLYRQPEVRSRIETLRAQQAPKRKLPLALRASDESKNTLIAEVREQNKKLRLEIQKLKRELEDAYSQIWGVEELQARNRELEKQNNHLFNLLTQARAEIDALKDKKQVNLNNVPY